MIEKIKEYRYDIWYYVALLMITLFIGVLSLGEGFDFDVYSSFEGDRTFGMMLVKSIKENGPLGIWFNTRVGTPETATIIDYPVLGNMMVLILWVISWFTSSIPRIMYTYLVVTFALDGLSMSFLLRKLNINRCISFSVSVLFAAAPFHFYRYLLHSSLINYMFIPIAIYLSLVILEYFQNEKVWKVILCAVLLGLGYGYYYAFGLILMAVALIMRFIKLDNKKEIINKIWIPFTVLGVVVLTLLPKMIYSLINGENGEVGQRLFYESEIYGLKIINLLLPVTYSRIDFLSNLTSEYLSSGAPLVNENSFASLGIIGSIGFIALCIAFFISFTKKKSNSSRDNQIVDFLCMETLVFLLTASIGGFGEVFNWALTAQIRCYNRSSIVITCLSLIMIAVLLNMIIQRKKKLAVIVTLVVLGIGLYDQINILSDNWQETSGIVATQQMYESYFEQVEDAYDTNAMIYQLPYLDFPEGGSVNGVSDYKHFIAYLFTDDLRWSYGAVRGRNNIAKSLNVDGGIGYKFVKEIQDAGFSAVYIDTAGFDDGGAEIISFYSDELGLTPIISGDGKLYTYDIRLVKISDNQMKTGYAFVDSCNKEYSLGLDEMQMGVLADSIGDRDVNSYLTLYSGVEELINTYNDSEYIDYLYVRLLGRRGSSDERQSWKNQLDSGLSRQDCFYSFLNSAEFRQRIGYDIE